MTEEDEAIAALKERLAQEKALQTLHEENERLGLYRDAYGQPEQEPVAWMDKYGEIYKDAPEVLSTDKPLYTSPPQRKPLTVWEIELWAAKPINRVALCRAIEAAHGIKENT